MTQLNMFSILLRTNLISSLSRRYISRSTVKRMSDPLMYDLCNTLQQQKASNLIKELADELINMVGKCIDIGCGSGNITKHILLPAVDTNAVITVTEMNPAEYASFDSLQKDRVQDVVNEFAKDLRNISGKCMDVGCGPGDITSDILLSALDPNAAIIGIDISESMIKYAKSMYGDKKQLEFEVLDIQTKNLPVKYISKFDHIFSFHTLQWCSNIRQAFENIYRMLRPGGTMLISLIKSNDTIYKVFETMAQDIRFAPYMKSRKEYISPFNDSIRPHEELKDLLKNIGFHVHHCSNREMTYDSDNLMRSVLAICLFLNEMPSNRREEFKIDFARKYTDKKIELYGNKEDNIKDLTIVPVRYEILIAYAQKNAL